MEPSASIIPTRSKQQALDWSLVLVSQGIESTIERDIEDGRWQLIVDARDSQRAIQALRQYKLENREAVWRHTLPWTGLIFDWRNIAWFTLVAGIFLLQQRPSSTLVSAGMMDRQAVLAGQWWRLFTAVT